MMLICLGGRLWLQRIDCEQRKAVVALAQPSTSEVPAHENGCAHGKRSVPESSYSGSEHPPTDE